MCSSAINNACFSISGVRRYYVNSMGYTYTVQYKIIYTVERWRTHFKQNLAFVLYGLFCTWTGP